MSWTKAALKRSASGRASLQVSGVRKPRNEPFTSTSRLSTDARNSGIGTSTRKDMRHVNDPGHKIQCINKIMQFLSSKGKSYQCHTLLITTTNDFKDIFHCYALPHRFEQVPKLMKNIHCPYELTKPSFVRVWSQHTWPVVLASLLSTKVCCYALILLQYLHQNTTLAF